MVLSGKIIYLYSSIVVDILAKYMMKHDVKDDMAVKRSYLPAASRHS